MTSWVVVPPEYCNRESAIQFMSMSESIKNTEALTEIISTGAPVALTAPLLLKNIALIGFYSETGVSGCSELPLKDLSSVGKTLYLPSHGHLIAHGLKHIWEYLGIGAPDLDTKLFTDTKLMGYLLDPDLGEDGLTLSNLASLHGVEEYPHCAVGVRDKCYPKAFEQGLAHDAETIFQLSHRLLAQMRPELDKLYRHVELPLMVLLNDMHRTGIGVDQTECSKLEASTEKRIMALEQDILGGRQVNLNSDRETFHFLVAHGVQFADPFVYTTQKASSHDLEEIGHLYPVAEKIWKWRSLSNDLAFLRRGSLQDRVHPVWGHTRSGTSRIYARDPAVQNVSRNLRHLFVPAPGHVLMKADYSQAQLRILAYLSKDASLTKLYEDPNGDAHTATSDWLGLKDRSVAKEINFAICYGMSAASLASRINEVNKEQEQPFIDEVTAQEYIDGFYRQYPGISEFFDREWEKLKKLPRKARLVTSPAGRIRRFSIRANPALERQFRVSLPQMMEADILKTAAVRLNRLFRRRRMGARIVMLIHDAIWVEAPEERETEVNRLMDKIMSTAGRPFLELKVDFSDS
jgi:DNA polymerase I